ncbi:DUF4190 domain-containing protein [Lysobacter sp. A3-1-A15]|uniref:DUF4190 domain-containing protein n=1 Tax=Novilysobacter viscosus TaxID=3098602 RepID=UPI002ED9D9A7
MNMPVPRTSTAAVISLVFGILSWFVLPLVGGVVAVVTGHVARGEIRRAAGSVDGDALAVAGLALGWTNLLVGVLAVMVFVVFFGGMAWLSWMAN